MTNSKNRKEMEVQGSRDRLMEAGIGLFAENGYASTSVREIVALAGVTKPVLYYYFKSKEGLFRAILDCASEWQDALIAEVMDMPGTALERIVLLYRRIYDALMENRGLFRMIHKLVFGLPQGSPPYDLERFHRLMVETVKAIYIEGLARGEVREADPEEVAFLVLGVTDFCLHLDHLHPEASDHERPERLLRLAFRGLAKP